ncbi:MAG TPA: hypothetical protein VMU89_15370 [Thermomicrobiaceae bacterium]|nr:hypothetical protein [Thermomicrobiaceae bacterium]
MPGQGTDAARADVVDDYRTVGEVVSMALTDDGYRVVVLPAVAAVRREIEAVRPGATLRATWERRPDGGLSLLHHLHHNPATRGIPVVVVRADGARPYRNPAALSDNCVAPLPRPFNLTDLLAAVEAVVARGSLAHQQP